MNGSISSMLLIKTEFNMILRRVDAHKSLSDFKGSDLKDSELIEIIKLSMLTCTQVHFRLPIARR